MIGEFACDAQWSGQLRREAVLISLKEHRILPNIATSSILFGEIQWTLPKWEMMIESHDGNSESRIQPGFHGMFQEILRFLGAAF